MTAATARASQRSTPPAAAAAAAEPSPWGPLRGPVFRALWIATVVSNVGTWMHDVGAAWLMAALSPDPLMVALVQAAATLPMFLLALPAGILADIADRRRFLLAAQIWTLAAALALGALALLGLVTPWVLLAATFALGVGAALTAPPFQAVVSEIVPRGELPAAVALNSLSINLSRAAGPALGGVVVSLAGPAAVFLLNGLSVLGVAWVVWRWRREPGPAGLPAEHFLPATRAGLRYVAHAPLLRAVIARAVAFVLPASAVWALLPVLARGGLGLSAAGYGLLLGSLGVGAVGGALLLPRARRAGIGPDAVLLVATGLFSAASAVLVVGGDAVIAAAALLPAGLAWMAALSTLNAAAQATSAGWVKARALAVYLVAFFGAMTVGSALWGQVAATAGVPLALGAAAVLGAVAGPGAAFLWRLRGLPALDLSPSAYLTQEPLAREVEHDRGPVLVTVEYLVDPAAEPGFVAAARELRRVRRRAGALTWGLYGDAGEPGRWVEAFVSESWLDHLRHHERTTRNDERLLAAARAFHQGPGEVRVTHLVAPGSLEGVP